MQGFLSDKRVLATLSGTAVLLGVLFAFLIYRSGSGDSGRALEGVFRNTVKKSQLIYSMSIRLLASSEAEKSSVMADTDEASNAYAEQAIKASDAVEEARRELGRLIEEGKERTEIELFREFSTCWSNYREIDRELLPLAVQNTNLKALRLSFVPAAAALRRMEAALDKLMDESASSPEAARINRVSSDLLVAAFGIYTLQAPHIAETTDEEMDKMETEMKRLDERVNEALSSLRGLADESGKAIVEEVVASYSDLRKINAEIVDLSRRNSNIRSFALSLGRKRKVTAQCLETLDSLQKAIQNTTFKATR